MPLLKSGARRKPGTGKSPWAMSDQFRDALAADFARNGVSAIARCRTEHVDVYINVIASLLLKEAR